MAAGTGACGSSAGCGLRLVPVPLPGSEQQRELAGTERPLGVCGCNAVLLPPRTTWGPTLTLTFLQEFFFILR